MSTAKTSQTDSDSLSTESTNYYRRTALLEGACGQAGRVQVCGQVVDLCLNQQQIKDKWEPFYNLPHSSIHTIRPLEDLSMPSVKKARLQLEILDVRPQDFELDQSESYSVCFCSPEYISDSNGFFAIAVPEALASKDYVVRIILRGINSARQSLKDLKYLSQKEYTQVLKTDICIGYGKLCILPPDFSDYILISDVDQTFLNTKMQTKIGLLATLSQKPKEKKLIDGMGELYRQITQTKLRRVPLFFLSASPHFFRRTFYSLFANHGLDTHGLYLKYLNSVVDNITDKVLDIAANPLSLFSEKGLRASLEGGMKFISTNMLSLFDQVGYKLEMLLRNRLMQPSSAKEILIGDNLESDFFIFTLYQLLLSGKCSQDKLAEHLAQVSFQGRESLTTKHIQTICRLTTENLNLHNSQNPVCNIWINRAKEEPNQKIMQELITSSLPGELRNAYSTSQDICQPRLCKHGFEMGLAAFDEGILQIQGVQAVLQDHLKNQDIEPDSTSSQQKLAMLKNICENFVFYKKTDVSNQQLSQELFS